VEPEKKQRKKNKTKVGKVRVKPKTIGIVAVKPNHYTEQDGVFLTK